MDKSGAVHGSGDTGGRGEGQKGDNQCDGPEYFHGEPRFGCFVDHTVMGNSVFTMMGRITERGMLKRTKKGN